MENSTLITLLPVDTTLSDRLIDQQTSDHLKGNAVINNATICLQAHILFTDSLLILRKLLFSAKNKND